MNAAVAHPRRTGREITAPHGKRLRSAAVREEQAVRGSVKQLRSVIAHLDSQTAGRVNIRRQRLASTAVVIDDADFIRSGAAGRWDNVVTHLRSVAAERRVIDEVHWTQHLPQSRPVRVHCENAFSAGTGLRQVLGPVDFVNHAALSGDGTKVGYDVIP